MGTMSVAWRRWQDWATAVIGVLFFVTPFVFGATASTGAAYTAYVGGVLLLIAGLWNLAQPTNVAIEWSEVVLGVLVFIAPFVLGFTALSAIAWSSWIAGVLAVVLAGSVLYAERDRAPMARTA